MSNNSNIEIAKHDILTCNRSLSDIDNDTEPNQFSSKKACSRCRLKKIKCNKALPVCLNCLTKSADCVYSTEEKTRGLKKGYIRDLEIRLSRMQDLIENSKNIPRELRKEASMIYQTNKELFNERKRSLKLDIVEPITKFQTKKYNRKDSKSRRDFFMVGTLKTRKYFGESTAPFMLTQHLPQQDFFDAPEIEYIKDPNSQIEDIDNRLNLELIKYITSRFLKYFYPILPIVDPNLVIERLYNYKNIKSFYTTNLPNYLFYAIISASCLSVGNNYYYKNTNILKLSCDCYEKAKSMIDKLIHNPTVPNIQTFILLSIATNPRNKYDEWLFSGIAIQMAITLGFHKNLEAKDNSPNFNTKRNIWWCCYIVDKLLSMAFGRPYMIAERDYDTQDINLGVHIIENKEKVDYLIKNSIIQDYNNVFDNYYFVKSIGFCKLTSKILNDIYSVKTSKNLLISDLFCNIQNADSELTAYYEHLKENHKFEKENSKNEFQLNVMNIYYYSLMISIYKPYLRRVRNKKVKKHYLQKLYDYSKIIINSIYNNLDVFSKSGILLKFHSIALSLSIFIAKYTLEDAKNDDPLIWIFRCLQIMCNIRFQTHCSTKMIAVTTLVFLNLKINLSDLIKKSTCNTTSELNNIILKQENILKKKMEAKKKENRSKNIKTPRGIKKFKNVEDKLLIKENKISFDSKFINHTNKTSTNQDNEMNMFDFNNIVTPTQYEDDFLKTIYNNIYDTSFENFS